ncbi:MAG: RluA family pseudouridine synthase [Deltaproteobacteria bacterium]|nr:RluA family pseudouridine synthase [Deltaproteobacteria bacterium]MBW2413583.1 RluA family pseudouridine synthase [Deltaproteobacteria bacterium]
MPSLSRAQVQRMIEAGAVEVSGRRVKAAHRLRAGERVSGAVPEPVPADRVLSEAIPLSVVFEDSDLIVVDKPAGLVVHPAAGHASGTLVNALLHHCGDSLSGVGGVLRPGIVHRLDKGTSGLIVAAKNDLAHRSLAAQFKRHSIDREYLALVRAQVSARSGSIDAPIGRHPTDRKRFSTRARRGRHAVTHWRVERRLNDLTLLRVRLETGRTHQIRVHLASAGMPVAGDPVYGGGRAVTRALGLERQALHATRLGFEHPRSGEAVGFDSPLPDDLARVVDEAAS